MRRARDNVARADVDDPAADRRRRVDREVGVLRPFVHRKRVLIASQVDAAHVHRVSRRVIDQKAQQHAVFARLEDVERRLVKRQQAGRLGDAAQHIVHMPREGANLRLGDGVSRTVGGSQGQAGH
eukprot:461520-Prymnesium_polylepis.1